MDMQRKVKGKGRIWSVEELNFVKDNYDEMTAREIAECLGRSIRSVTTIVYRLKKKIPMAKRKARPIWSDEDKILLLKNRGKCSADELASVLGRSCGAVKEMLRRLDENENANLKDGCWHLDFFDPDNNATFAVISMCIKEDMNQNLYMLARRLAKTKRLSTGECYKKLIELKKKKLLGFYNENGYFTKWTKRQANKRKRLG